MIIKRGELIENDLTRVNFYRLTSIKFIKQIIIKFKKSNSPTKKNNSLTVAFAAIVTVKF